MDGTGNVFVADSGNSTIRKITASGLVSTIGGRAGEQGWLSGTAARFYGPMGIAVTEGGQLYVADDGNHRVVTTVGVSAKLNDMIISSGVLDPAFSGNTTGYTASVGDMTGTITLTPTAEPANAMIQVRCNGGAYTNVTSGTVSAPLPVNMGANTLEVRVVSGNGLNVKTYSVMVTRRTGVKAQIVSPANGITLDNTWLTLTWRNGIGVTSYVLWVGTTAGGYDVYSGVETGTSRTVVAPAGKRTYVTLWSVINGV